jgi:hypothetical protein
MKSAFTHCIFDADVFDTTVAVQVIECMRELQVMLKRLNKNENKWFAELFVNCPYDIQSLEHKEHERLQYKQASVCENDPVPLKSLLHRLFSRQFLNAWLVHSKRFTFHLAVSINDRDADIRPFVISPHLLEMFDMLGRASGGTVTRTSFLADLGLEKFAFIQETVTQNLKSLKEEEEEKDDDDYDGDFWHDKKDGPYKGVWSW